MRIIVFLRNRGGRLLCRCGIHHTTREPYQLGHYGMGLEYFEVKRCTRCLTGWDRLRQGRYRSWWDRDFWVKQIDTKGSDINTTPLDTWSRPTSKQ